MDSDLIKKFQRSFISRVCNMCNVGKYFNYDQRLKLFNLESLHERRIIGDIIEVYKIVQGYMPIGPIILLMLYLMLILKTQNRTSF